MIATYIPSYGRWNSANSFSSKLNALLVPSVIVDPERNIEKYQHCVMIVYTLVDPLMLVPSPNATPPLGTALGAGLGAGIGAGIGALPSSA